MHQADLPPLEKTFFSANDLAPIFAVTPHTVRAWAHEDLFSTEYVESPYETKTERRAMLFPATSVLAFVLSGRKPLPPSAADELIRRMRVHEFSPRVLHHYCKEKLKHEMNRVPRAVTTERKAA